MAPTVRPTSLATCLWFDGTAEEAATFYAATLPDSEVLSVERAATDYPAGKAGDVLAVRVRILGQMFTALNGGPGHPFTDAISFQVECADQAEVDRIWAALTDGGSAVMCGWLTDRYGVSWQVIPMEMNDYIGGPDPEGAARAMRAMMEMVKLDVAALRRAYEGAG